VRQDRKPYRYGYLVEHECRRRLREKLAAKYVIRSSRSLGPADLIAVFPEKREIWLIQVKKAEAPEGAKALRRMFKELISLSGKYRVIPYAFMKVKGRYTFINLEET